MNPGSRWILLVVGLLVGSLLTHGVLIAAAVLDPGFAVLPRYEAQAADWDAVAAAQRASAELEWSMDLRAPADAGGVRLTIALRDRDGAAVQDAVVTVETFFNARAARIVAATLTESTPGDYAAVLPIGRSGLWEFNVRAVRPDARFIERRRVHVVIPNDGSHRP